MQLSKKIKTALDETRMLILGAQILLGFELRAAFSEGFDKLPDHARDIEAIALMLSPAGGRRPRHSVRLVDDDELGTGAHEVVAAAI